MTGNDIISYIAQGQNHRTHVIQAHWKIEIWAAQKQFINTTKQIRILLAYYLILLTRFLTQKIEITKKYLLYTPY